MTAAQTEPRARWLARTTDTQLPLWLRVYCYAEAHADRSGHCPLFAGQLHQAIDPTRGKDAISNAIAKCVQTGWLHPSSSARCLVLEPAGPHACPATHRSR